MTQPSEYYWAKLTATEVVNVILKSVELLDELENSETPEHRRTILMDRAPNLVPITFSAQAEPWASITSSLTRLRATGHNMLAISSMALNKMRGKPTLVRDFLILLAETSTYGDDLLAFELSRHGSALQLLQRNDIDTQLALLKIASRGGVISALAMISQIRQTGELGTRAAAAFVRIAASREPSQITLAFSSVREELENSSAGPIVRELAIDILRRTSHQVLLRVISELNVRDWPELTRAMFGGQTPLFRLVATIGSDDRLDIECSVQRGMPRTPIAALNLGETWHLDICEIAGIRPSYQIQEAGPYGPSFDDQTTTQDGSLVATAKKKLAA